MHTMKFVFVEGSRTGKTPVKGEETTETCACGYSMKARGVGYWSSDGWICKKCGDVHTPLEGNN